MLRVADCIAGRIRFAVPQTTEWQGIADEIDAAMILARVDFVNVSILCHDLALSTFVLERRRFTHTANSTARKTVCNDSLSIITFFS